MALKRKATEQDDRAYDSDEIQVTQTVPSRKVLDGVSVEQSQNKRRKVLDCVLVPTSRETQKLIADAQWQTLPPRARYSTLRRAPSDDGESSAQDDIPEVSSEPLASQPAKRRVKSVAAPKSTRTSAIATALTRSSTDDTVRSRSQPLRQSKLSFQAKVANALDDSGDELVVKEPSRPKKRQPAKRSQSLSSVYSLNSASSAGESEDSDESDILSGESSPPTDDEFSEQEKKASVGKAKVVAKKTPSAPVKTKSAKAISKAVATNMKNISLRSAEMPKGLDLSLPPMHAMDDIFADLTTRAVSLGFDEVIKHMTQRPLRVATMLSGTESPFLALEMIQDALRASSVAGDLQVEHLFSAEIVPFKQGYIERNFNPPKLFRDITELIDVVNDEVPMATTAYGARISVPTDIDLVVAGTSCVDFSALNKFKKTIDEEGESGKTWEAVLAFCKAFRPAIVLIENVKNAPWDVMLRSYEEAGYVSAGVHVDTKNYYIPQTRQRGYMVCFDHERLRAAGIEGAGEQWQDLMEKFKRFASSPVSDFLMPSDQVSKEQANVEEVRREVDWAKCAITQAKYRQEKKLGTGRPFTHWQESGSTLPLDFSSHQWHSSQVERVLDSCDAAALRKAREGYDVRFKTRVIDLSQNIYMNEDTVQFGIAGCLTPSGLNFVTSLWREMTAEECLRLQGIPLNKISFTVETPAEVRDLAGNAMSTTVVGAAIVSSLIAGHKMFDRSTLLPGSSSAAASIADADELITPQLQAVPIEVEHSAVDMSSMTDLANRALRRCYCEGGFGMTKRPLQQCADCGHTTCVSCGGNPVHRYIAKQDLSKGRITMFDFDEQLRHRLPLRLKLTGAPAPNDAARAAPKNYYDIVRPLTASSFSLFEIRRTSCIRVIYRSSSGRLELCLTERGANWHLYADAPADLASNASMRETLSQPIATSVVEDSLLRSPWKWRAPAESTSKASVTGSGNQLPTWWARMQLPDYDDHCQWQFLDFSIAGLEQELSGTYEYLPACGTACESLYKRVAPPGKHPIYLFLDPTRVGPEKEDRFVFSRDHSRLDRDEIRQEVARVNAAWRPWQHGGDTSAWDTDIKSYEWQSRAGLFLENVDAEFSVDQAVDISMAASTSSCDQALTLARTTSSHRPETLRNGNGPVALDDAHFFEHNAWLFEAMRRQLRTNEWSPMSKPLVTGTAELYERAMKARKCTIVIHVDDHGISLGVNLVGLAHRASSRLPAIASHTKYEWRLSTSADANLALKTFRLTQTGGVCPNSQKVLTKDLFPTQQLALAWMEEQERDDGKSMVIEEAEECSIPNLNWRLELRANSTVNIRGGICADHPGFGKTITSLALVQSQWSRLGPKGIHQQLESGLGDCAPGLLTSCATLVICPKSLITQWVKEAQDKLGSSNGIVSIPNASYLAKTSIASFESAKLIFVTRQTLVSAAYVERLTAFAAMPGPAKDQGRAYSHWHKHAEEQIPEHLERLRNSGQAALVQHLKAKYAQKLQSDEFNRNVPSQRLKGRAFQEAAKAKAKVNTKAVKIASGSLETKLVGPPLFEMFYFNRIIVDEFHQCDTKELDTIAALKADKRWGLSGTPALADCYDVAQIARLLGCPLRIGSVARGVMKQRNMRAVRKDMTAFELFDQRRTVPSNHQQARIHELAQTFLDTFVRRNVMDFAELTVRQHLMPVHLDTVHHALYHELSQHLNSSDMRIKRTSRSKTTDRELQIDAATADSQTAEEALSKAALSKHRSEAIPPSQQGYLFSWISNREHEADDLTDKLGPAIAAAHAQEPEEYASWKSSILDKKRLGDESTTQTVRELCDKYEGAGTATHKGKNKSKSKSTDDEDEVVGVRDRTSELNKIVARLLVSNRSLRYLQNVQRMQGLSSSPQNHQVKCDDSGCSSELSRDAILTVSGLCGHMLCKGCYERRQVLRLGSCPSDGCHASLEAHHLLWNNTLGGSEGSKDSGYGAKIEAALSVLDNIQRNREQAVLFVQFENQLDEVGRALSDRGITAIVVKDSATAGTRAEQFCNKRESTVIVLNVSDDTSAGLNLQTANHVIFLSPLLKDSQYDYDSIMAQAIGRVRRHGQKKEIHVYRIIALNTIDVDILEHRERRTDALTQRGVPDISPPPAATILDMNEKPKQERTQLVKEDGKFSLRPQSWLVRCGAEDDPEEVQKVKGRSRVGGWEDFSSLVKFSRAFTEDDE